MENILYNPMQFCKVKGDNGAYKIWAVDWLTERVLLDGSRNDEWVSFDKIKLIPAADINEASGTSTNSRLMAALESDAKMFDAEYEDHKFQIFAGRARGLRDAMEIIERLNASEIKQEA
jgi:hypothetical protein